jgi:threonine dehydratase
MTDLETLEAAAVLVHRVVAPTPQYCWPLLSRWLGAELWVKHENHTPIGAFKIRSASCSARQCGPEGRARAHARR